MRIKETEYDAQVALFEWVFLMESRIPELRLLFHIPNGELRHPVVARKLQKMGVRSGIPDLLLCVARPPWHGLFVEMKSTKGKLRPEQKEWITMLCAQGYMVAICYGWESAKHVILTYLGKEG